MPASIHTVLADINEKLSALERQRQEWADRCIELEKANADLELRLKEAVSERDRALLDAQYLTLSHRLAEDPDTIIDARRKISSLIRRVDKAIRLVTDDPSL